MATSISSPNSGNSPSAQPERIERSSVVVSNNAGESLGPAPSGTPPLDVPQLNAPPLVDTFGRVHTSLRISVTDRCNIRCSYCMPDGPIEFLPKNKLLSFNQIENFVRALVPAGCRKVRITGGEPLVRPNLDRLIGQLAKIPGVDDLALTTNGILLDEQLPQLVDAGLKRINISLDTLSEERFFTISRRPGLDRVLRGIQRAQQYEQLEIRLNALVLKQVNEEDVIPLAQFARAHALPIRFIEFMPLDADRKWNGSQWVSGAQLREVLGAHFGPLIPISSVDPSQPASDYRFADGLGTIGFIDSVSQPFCQACNRLRLTAEGKLRNCLFGTEEWDLAPLLPDTMDESAAILDVVREAVSRKKRAHGIDQPQFVPPQRAMFQIGG